MGVMLFDTAEVYGVGKSERNLAQALGTPAMKARLYASLGVRLEYDHVLKRVRATAEAARVPRRVRRGT